MKVVEEVVLNLARRLAQKIYIPTMLLSATHWLHTAVRTLAGFYY